MPNLHITGQITQFIFPICFPWKRRDHWKECLCTVEYQDALKEMVMYKVENWGKLKKFKQEHITYNMNLVGLSSTEKSGMKQ